MLPDEDDANLVPAEFLADLLQQQLDVLKGIKTSQGEIVRMHTQLLETQRDLYAMHVKLIEAITGVNERLTKLYRQDAVIEFGMRRSTAWHAANFLQLQERGIKITQENYVNAHSDGKLTVGALQRAISRKKAKSDKNQT